MTTMTKSSENVDHTTDTRYPNTYAYDFVRGLAGHTAKGTRLDRGTAGQMCKGLALALGIPERDLVCRLADYAKANDDDLAADAINSFQQAQQVCATALQFTPGQPAPIYAAGVFVHQSTD